MHCAIRVLYNYAGFCHRRSHMRDLIRCPRTVVMAIDVLITRRSYCTTFVVVQYFTYIHKSLKVYPQTAAVSSPSMVSRTLVSLCLYSKIDIDLV